MSRAAIILAAGQGTRMKSALPKVMHKVAHLPMLGHVIRAAKGAGVDRIVVVTAADGEAVREFARKHGAESVVQDRQLGTGHAAAYAADVLREFSGEIITAYGDMPLVTPAIFEASFAAREKSGMAIVAFRSTNKAYGRVIAQAGILDRIVEYRDANEAERAIDLCNAGIMAADAKHFFRWCAKLENNNSQKEYNLTDVPALAKGEGIACAVVEADESEMMGVNSRAELAAAESAMQKRLRAAALDKGVGMIAPETVFFSYDTQIEADALIAPYVIFGPGVKIASGAEIRSFSHLEGAEVARGAVIGPYARLRPGANIGEGAFIGNFVEVKNTKFGAGAKANHLTYLGDARVGAAANIGAGTITCNYDGFDKHVTDIGAGAFIGSNSALVAPVKIGDGAFVGAGSVIAGEDVAPGALAVVRAARQTIAGWAEKFRERKRAKKG